MTRSARLESIVQVGILLIMGGMAGAASFVHIHDLTVSHGQPSWIGWANAVVVELMSIAAGLESRRRKRAGQPKGLVLAILLAAAAVSLAAQVAQAERSPWGWLVAALPALGFLAVVKIVLSRTPAVSRPVRSVGEDAGPVEVVNRSIDRDTQRLDVPGDALRSGPVQPPVRTAGRPLQTCAPDVDRTATDPPVPRPRISGHRVDSSVDESPSGKKPARESGSHGPRIRRTGDRSDERVPGLDRSVRKDEDLLELWQAIASDLTKTDQKLTRQVLITKIRGSGRSIGTDRASDLLRLIKANMALARSG